MSISARVPGVNGPLGVTTCKAEKQKQNKKTTCKALRPVGRKLKAAMIDFGLYPSSKKIIENS